MEAVLLFLFIYAVLASYKWYSSIDDLSTLRDERDRLKALLDKKSNELSRMDLDFAGVRGARKRESGSLSIYAQAILEIQRVIEKAIADDNAGVGLPR